MKQAGEFVCPLCFSTFLQGGACEDCGSEAIDVSLVPVADFMRRTTVADLEELSLLWSEAPGFYLDYKAAKQKRIDRMLERRRKLGA